MPPKLLWDWAGRARQVPSQYFGKPVRPVLRHHFGWRARLCYGRVLFSKVAGTTFSAMPFRRRYKRRTPYWNKFKPVVPNLGLPGQAYTKMVHLRYANHFNSLQNLNGLYIVAGYYANRITDCAVAAGTRDALGTDQYMGSTLGGTAPMYQRYIVLGAKIYVSAIVLTGGPLASPVVFGVRQETLSVGTNTSWMDDAEDRHGTWAILNSFNNKPVVAVAKYSAANTFGGFDAAMDVTLVTGRNGSPADPTYFGVWYQPLDAATTIAAGAIRFQVVIDYAVLLIEPVDALASA